MEEEIFSLSEVLNAVSRAIQRNLAGPYWTCAEIAEISYRGHCYLTLAETDASGRIIAKCRATMGEKVQSRRRVEKTKTTKTKMDKSLCIINEKLTV